MLEREGEEWADYWRGENRDKYTKTLLECTKFLCFDQAELVGFIRVREDGPVSVFIMDLLVDKNHREKGYGSALLNHAKEYFPGKDVYVLGASEVYDFYEKLGYTEEGKVYKL